jgi:hypothetical protein
MEVWNLYQNAKQWGARPSELLGITDLFDAYCLDDAVGWFGSEIESELIGIEGKTPQETKARRERLLLKILGGGSRFADPVAMGVVSVDTV